MKKINSRKLKLNNKINQLHINYNYKNFMSFQINKKIQNQYSRSGTYNKGIVIIYTNIGIMTN